MGVIYNSKLHISDDLRYQALSLIKGLESRRVLAANTYSRAPPNSTCQLSQEKRAARPIELASQDSYFQCEC